MGLFGFNFVSQTAAQSRPKSMARKIVVFKSGVLNEQAREELINRFGGVKVKDLTLIDGKAVILPEDSQAALVQQVGVLRVEDDVEVFALENPANNFRSFRRSAFIQPAQVLPWGIDRIDAEKVWATSTADTIKVAIIDTGIDKDHADLIANLRCGVNFVSKSPVKPADPNKWDDDNGHGTHVAGIVATVDNEIGVIGTAPEAYLWAVKVLDSNGSGYVSDVIDGINWAITNHMQVTNMSLGTTANILSFQEAIQRANAAGITQVAAAGNSGGAVNYPAAYPEVIAVSATDIADNIPYWSSRGSEVDLSAPGVSIYSTYKGGKYKTLSGTSMAAPHVAGAAALVIDKKTCDYDFNGICSPAEVQQRLEATAEDLGITGKDNLYGSGLVDAEKALMP